MDNKTKELTIEQKRKAIGLVRQYLIDAIPSLNYLLAYAPCWVTDEDIWSATDGRSIKVGNKFFNGNHKEQAAEILKRGLKIFLRHKGRLQDLDGLDGIGGLASELLVNEALERVRGIVEPVSTDFKFSSFDIFKNFDTNQPLEKIYVHILKNCDLVNLPPDFFTDISEDYGTSVLPEYLQDFYNKSEDFQKESLNRALNNMNAASKAAGDSAGSLVTEISEFIETSTRWDKVIKVLKAAVSKLVSSYWEKNPRRASRAMRATGERLFIPARRLVGKEAPTVIQINDCSGSVPDTDLSRFCSEGFTAMKQTGCNLLITFADVKLQPQTPGAEDYLVEYDDPEQLASDIKTRKIKAIGRGGTDFQKPIQQVVELCPEADMIIYLTDGYGNFGDPPANLEVVWAMTSDVVPPWGTVLKLEGLT